MNTARHDAFAALSASITATIAASARKKTTAVRERTNGRTDGRRARTKSEHARLSTRVVHTSASSNTGGGVAGTCVGSPSATSAMPAAAARRDTDEEDASGDDCVRVQL